MCLLNQTKKVQVGKDQAQSKKIPIPKNRGGKKLN